MEKIGTTPDRAVLVKMTNEEYSALEALAIVVEGKNSLMNLSIIPGRELGAVNIETALGAVREYATNRDLKKYEKYGTNPINRLKKCLMR